MIGGEELLELPVYTHLNGSERDLELAREILRLTHELRVLLGQYAMYRRLTGDREFGEAVDRSPAVNGLRVLIGALLRTIVVSSAAIFDPDPKTSNIKKIIIKATNKANLDFLGRMHAAQERTEDFEQSRERLTDYRRRLNKGRLHLAIARLMHVRSTMVAHFDANPSESPEGQSAVVGDVQYVVAAAAIIVVEANFLILGREVAYAPLRELLRKEAEGLKAALMAGSRAAALDR